VKDLSAPGETEGEATAADRGGDAAEDPPPAPSESGERGSPSETEEKGPASGKRAAAEWRPGPRAARFARGVIGLAMFLALSQAAFAVQLSRPKAFVIGPLLFAAALGATFLLKLERRLMLALTVLPAMLMVYAFEARNVSNRPRAATMSARRGVEFDNRSLWEAIRDARAEGKDAFPSIQPRALMVLDMEKGIWPDELANFALSEHWGVVVDGERVLPLGGVSDKHIVNCNEGGRYAEYRSDEHGFNNPKGIWTRDTIDVALLGDSYTQAACVGPDEDSAHWIRKRYPATVNLGMAGNGPLIELAGLDEYVAPKKPKIVFWLYYNNDMSDLGVERQLPMLVRHVEEEGFTQGLRSKQPRIDAALVDIAARLDAVAPRWPGALGAIGLTRTQTPVWLGDLVMGESYSSTISIMRLDRLTWGLTTKLISDPLNAPSDVPYFKKVLEKARDRVASWGGKLYFVYIADMFYLLQYQGKREHHDRPAVLAAVKDLGIPLVDTQAVFREVPDPMTVRFSGESHCNPTGYKLLAEQMLKAVDESGQ
jgi:hypothetical protein